MGRMTILTPELQERILNFVKTGVPLEVAAQAAGVSPSAFWSWMAAGEGRPSHVQPSELYEQFAQKVRTTEASTHALVVGTIRTAAVTNGNWQAAAAYARMRWSKFYAERVEVGGPDAEPLGDLADHEKVLLRKAIDEYVMAHPEVMVEAEAETAS